MNKKNRNLFCDPQKSFHTSSSPVKLRKALLINEPNNDWNELTQWLSSNLSYFASLNDKAFVNLFCIPQKEFLHLSGIFRLE